MAHNPSRRAFLGESLLSLTGLSWLGQAEAADPMAETGFIADSRCIFLGEQEQQVIAAILPVALGIPFDFRQAKDLQLAQQTLLQLDRLIGLLSPRNRSDLLLLLNLLSMRWTRRLLGMWSPWERAKASDVDHFLSSWQQSSLSLKRFGYQSLMQLLDFAYYGQKAGQTQASYPGVPLVIRPFLAANQGSSR